MIFLRLGQTFSIGATKKNNKTNPSAAFCGPQRLSLAGCICCACAARAYKFLLILSDFFCSARNAFFPNSKWTSIVCVNFKSNNRCALANNFEMWSVLRGQRWSSGQESRKKILIFNFFPPVFFFINFLWFHLSFISHSIACAESSDEQRSQVRRGCCAFW